ncbi:AAA family ATPase [Neiella marina]|uniref:endopeptidase La n=1 Tax=Neiella holothuriorum TaxID=2870530 RepID=A0ABS7EF64_9GAMM|nr:Lon-insertion domain-containing protein [Neiella holothuriorum]MBW8190327.1 AAA family ATPase [Neiella holothuriorum]
MTDLCYGPSPFDDAVAQPLTYGQDQFVASATTAFESAMHLRAVVPVGVDLTCLVNHLEISANPQPTALSIAFDGNQGTLTEQAAPEAEIDHYCDSLSSAALFGHLSYSDEQWHFSAGLLWRSERQLIVIDAAQLLANQTLNDALITTMASGVIAMPFVPTQKHPLPSLPNAPLRSTIVIQGNAQDMFALGECYPRLATVAPLHVELADRIHRKLGPEYLGYLKSLAELEHAQFDMDGLQRLAKTASRWAEHNEYVSLNSGHLRGLIREAKHNAGQSVITATTVEATLANRRNRVSDLAQSSYQDFVDGSMLLDVTGAKVGQVNGLTVVDVGDVCYGEPARITASVHYGDGDVVDIERKAELAGNIHAKGTMILAAYVTQIFAKDAPLHLSANIVFEQSYYEVDGDSASLAELIALLSALSRIPVHQNMAVTGAIDQFGNVQSIGGINEKVDGFWSVASRLAPEQQFVIVMPKSNLLQFNPTQNVAEAIASKKLLIKGVSHVADAVEILTGVPSGVGQEDERQRFPEDTVFRKVQRRLLDLADPDESANLNLLQVLRQWWRGEL